MKSKLQQRYEAVVAEYVKRFAKKQGLEFSYWVAEEVGEIACFISEYFFHFNDIVRDIDTNQPEGQILQWHNEGIEHQEKTINYRSYLMGLRFGDVEPKTNQLEEAFNNGYVKGVNDAFLRM